jgi:hypothetical protein
MSEDLKRRVTLKGLVTVQAAKLEDTVRSDTRRHCHSHTTSSDTRRHTYTTSRHATSSSEKRLVTVEVGGNKTVARDLTLELARKHTCAPVPGH